MYVTIKLEGNVGTIHSVNVDGKEIIPEWKYNIAPHKFNDGGHEGFGLRAAVDRILNKKESENKELEIRKREKEEIEKKRKEYYEAHMKEETERLNKLVDWYKLKLNEIREASVDSRPRKLEKLYQRSEKNKDLGVTITKFGTLNPVNYPKYPHELEIIEQGDYDDEIENVFYDSPTDSSLPSNYKPSNHNKYFRKTIKMYQGHLNVKDELIETIRVSLGPRRYTVNKVKDKIGELKFTKDLANSIVRNLNGDPDYKHLTEFQLASLLKYYEEFKINIDKALGKQVKYKSNVLFHLLRLIGYKPDPDDFPLNSRVSNERTESEIETVFNFMGWNYKPM